MNSTSGTPVFFIIGRPRSGTTLIRTMLDAHPNVNIPVECPLVVNLYHKYKRIKKWDSFQRSRFFADVTSQWKFESWSVDKEKLKSDIENAPESTGLAELIKIVFASYPSFFAKEDILLLGDKNPVYSLKYSYMKILLKVFPEAKFLHITRDYRDNFLSYQKVDFEAPVTSLICYRWKHSAHASDRLREKTGDKFYSFRYEDLISDPENKLTDICRFLGIKYNSCMLNYHKKKDEFIKLYSVEIMEKYHKNAMTPVNADKAFEWKKKMPVKKVKIADFTVGKTAEKMGYERQFTQHSTVTVVKALPGITYGKFWFFLSAIIDSMPYRIRNSVIRKGPVMAWFYGKIFRRH
ncbi:MAG: hypothetical protein A2W91_17755 [Bacteroidetes bacterium GWF2_38_335]|nr:MAG: hypothetical protein A2W91_17755 [Bacteroidetes bacterium GWF2_38_335]OFY78020.1 MAG: hypothetical protein A2281_18705 [Bacteroidetes bacterium RIFOXYA12_FULL_38_20]HBS88292.1 hypothetical protein [Bacteroidales bacterium]